MFLSRRKVIYIYCYIHSSVHPIACRCLELFVRHSSLVCPLGEGGKMQLAVDYARVEVAVAPFCHKVSELGRSYRLIRAVR